MTTENTRQSAAMLGAPREAVAACPIVGIGASAGGLEAFEAFFRACPPDTGMAFVLVPHLSPDHHSLLTEILQRCTAMPVAQALDQVQVEPNHVYIIPPNRDMALFHGVLQITVPDVARGQHLPIDGFFGSLADDQAEQAIGIILSGTASDGTQGLRGLAMHVIAEGVETEAQHAFLETHGCNAYQGFLFGRPLPLDVFEALLHST